MLKRLNSVIAVLMVVSMLVPSLASATQVASQDDAVQEPAPVNIDPEVEPAPGPQTAFAPPTVLDPLPTSDALTDTPFELTSVIRSCEDQTRFDLEWKATEQIVSMEYLLFNSSDNSSTEGFIDGSNGFGTTATIWGKPGDTAMSLDVTLVSGEEYRYLANASVCDVSSASVVGAPPVTHSTITTAPNSMNSAADTEQEVSFIINDQGIGLPGTHFITISDSNGVFITDVWQNYLGLWRTMLDPGTYVWSSAAVGPWQAASGSFTVGQGPLTVHIDLYAANNGVIRASVELPEDYANHSPFLSFRLSSPVTETQTFGSQLLNGTVTIGPIAYGDYSLEVQTPWRSEWSQPVAVHVDDDEVDVTLTMQKPDTSILEFTIDAGSVPIEDGIIRITGGLVWNGEYYNHTVFDKPGVYEIEVIHPTEDYPLDFSIRAANYEEIYGEWYPGDDVEIHVELQETIQPTPTKVIDIILKDVDSGDNVGGLGLYSRNSCGEGAYVDQVGDTYQLMVFDHYEGYCVLAVYSGEYGGFQEWYFWISEVEETLVYELNWDSDWAKDVTIQVSVPEGIIPKWVHLHYEQDPSGISAEIDRNGIAQFSALRKGTYGVTVSTDQEHYMTAPVEDIVITSQGESFQIEVIRNPELVTVNVEVRTSDGGVLPTPLRVSHSCGAKCGEVPHYILSPTGSTTSFQLEYPYDWPLTLQVGAIGKYRFSSVAFVPSDTQQVTLSLQAITSIPTTPTAYLSSSTGLAGSTVNLTGGGYAPNETVEVYWNTTSGTKLGETQASATGSISTTIKIPDSAQSGSHEIVTLSTSDRAANATFTVNLLIDVALTPSSGQAGTVTSISGSGFTSGETVTLRWNTEDGEILGAVSAEEDGTFSGRITIPPTASTGSFNIHAVGESGQSANASYDVTLLADVVVNLSINSGRAGSITAIMGSGFQPGETVTIRWDGENGTVLGWVTASPSGTMVGKVTVPPTAAIGSFNFHISGDNSGQNGSALYEVTSLAVVGLNLSLTSGRAGSVTAVMGSGFQPGETVTIRWGSATGTTLGWIKASPSGTISGKVTIPPTANRKTYAIVATGDNSNQYGATPYSVTHLAKVEVNLSLKNGRAGSITAVMGSGFQPGETVTIRWGSTNGRILGVVKASSSGTVVGKITVPATAQRKSYAIVVSGTSGQIGVAPYAVTSLAAVDVNLSLSSGRAGSITAVMGGGFQPGESVSIRWGSDNGRLLGVVKASPSGTIGGKITIPANSDAQAYLIYVSAPSGQSGTARYVVSTTAAQPMVRNDALAWGHHRYLA